MKFTEFFSGQRVIRQVLDWLQTSKHEVIEERITDVYSDGVVDSLLSNLNIYGKDLSPTLTDFFHVQIKTGVAYKNGERILISDDTIPYTPANLTHTTDNGAGFPVSTPRSTGSYDIFLTSGFVNYIYIAYVQTTDDSVFTLHKITQTKIFYKRTDGFEVFFNTTGVNPDPTRYILLGTVNLTGANTAVAANISITGRSHFRITKLRVGIETNNANDNLATDRPTVYDAGNNNYSLDDHIKSVGTGHISNFNPHGLSADDLGLTESQLVRSHRRSEHQNGIIAGTAADPAPITSGLFVQMIDVFPHGIGDYVTVKPLLGGELAIVDGLAFDNSDFPTPVDIHFDSDPTGTYHIYFDSVTGTVGKTTISIVGDTTKIWLSDVTWNFGTLDITSTIDHRRFGTVQRLARWYTAGRPQGGEVLRGSFGYNLTLDKLEYYNGVGWVQLP